MLFSFLIPDVFRLYWSVVFVPPLLFRPTNNLFGFYKTGSLFPGDRDVISLGDIKADLGIGPPNPPTLGALLFKSGYELWSND